METIPVTVLNGTLGSGKTTLVKQLLQHPRYAGAFLVENEFASVNIDRATVADEHEGELYEISGSCICCGTGEELEAAFAEIHRRQWAGPVILESTGMADSVALLGRLMSNPAIVQHFQIERAVLVVDAAAEANEAGPLRPDLAREARLSDMIIINKADLAPAAAASLQQALSSLNPQAQIVATSQAQVPASLWEASGPALAEARLAEVLSAGPAASHSACLYAVYVPERPLDPNTVRAALQPGRFPAGVQLRRAKGFFQDAAGTTWRLEATAHHAEVTRTRQPHESVIVGIGEGMTKAALREVLA